MIPRWLQVAEALRVLADEVESEMMPPDLLEQFLAGEVTPADLLARVAEVMDDDMPEYAESLRDSAETLEAVRP